MSSRISSNIYAMSIFYNTESFSFAPADINFKTVFVFLSGSVDGSGDFGFFSFVKLDNDGKLGVLIDPNSNSAILGDCDMFSLCK